MSDKCPWCGEGKCDNTDPNQASYGCRSVKWSDGAFMRSEWCHENERDQLKARIAELERERDNFHAESIELQKENVDLERRFEELQAAIKAGANDCPICTGSGELVDGVYAWDCGESPPSCGACKGTGRTSGMVERISDLESERNALTLERDAARDEMRIFRDRSRSVSERRVRLIERLAKEWRQFRSERDALRAELDAARAVCRDSVSLATDVWAAHWNGFMSASRNIKADDCPYTTAVFRTAWILGTACGGFSRLEKQDFDSLDARSKHRMSLVKRLAAELRSLRAGLGADDDELITHEWMTATYGAKWSIPVENGVIHVFDECPYEFGEDDYEETLTPWFQMVGRHDMVALRPEIKTRGDVRRLVAALKPAGAGGER